MAYKFQLGAARLSGSIVAEGDLTAESSVVSGSALSGAAIALGDAGGIAGAALVNNGGVLDVSGLSDTEIDASAGIQFSKMETITAADIIVGDASGVPTAVAISGDIGIDDAGVTTIQSGRVSGSMLNSNVVSNTGGLQLSSNELGINLSGSQLTTSSAGLGVSPTLAALSDLSTTDGNIIVGDGSTFVVESGNTARTSLGLGNTDDVTFADVTGSSGSFNGDLVINGDLTILGGVVSASTSQLLVEDALITIADGASSFATGRGFEIGGGTAAEGNFKTDTTNFGQGNVNHFASSLALSASSFYGSLAFLPDGVTTSDWSIDSTAISGNLPITASGFSGDGSGLTGVSATAAGYEVNTYPSGTATTSLGGKTGVHLVDAANGQAAVAITLELSGNWNNGDTVLIKGPSNASTNNLTIQPSGSDLIEGGGSIVIESDAGAVQLVRVGPTAWVIF